MDIPGSSTVAVRVPRKFACVIIKLPALCQSHIARVHCDAKKHREADKERKKRKEKKGKIKTDVII